MSAEQHKEDRNAAAASMRSTIARWLEGGSVPDLVACLAGGMEALGGFGCSTDNAAKFKFSQQRDWIAPR